MFERILKIGTRGSPLAMTQTRTVEAHLKDAFPALETEIVVIHTSGDWSPDEGEVRLSAADGGKGQFAKEIEEALLRGDIDIAVHSMKDMDSFLPDGLVLDHMIAREDPRDALLFSQKIRDAGVTVSNGFDAIPQEALVGTASVRRAALLKAKRPDLEITPIRGNVHTRIDKVRSGQVMCTCLAMAGLNRLDIAHEADVILEPEDMLPAAGQGAVGIECRDGDDKVLSLIDQINHWNTLICVKAERAVLAVLDGSCHTPIGAYAVFENGQIWLRCVVAAEDGSLVVEDDITRDIADIEDAQSLGRELGVRLKTRIPPEILNHG